VRIAAGANLVELSGVAANSIGIDRSGGRPQQSNSMRRRAPQNAAVAIKLRVDCPLYADIIKQARDKVNLKDQGITNPRMRRAVNGGVIIEIPGPEGATKADILASRLHDIIGGNAVVSRPIVKADLKISGFDESVIKNELITMVTELGDCLASDVRIGSFRAMRNGLSIT